MGTLFSTQHVDLGLVTNSKYSPLHPHTNLPGREDKRFSFRAKVRSFFKLQTSLGN